MDGASDNATAAPVNRPALRRSGTLQAAQATVVVEFELALGHLRVPEIVLGALTAPS
jgi:hypothetical protein